MLEHFLSFTDLKEDKLDTLDDYEGIYRHVPVKAPTDELDHLKLEGCVLILLDLCCCREGSTVFLKLPNVETRATLRHKISSAILENLPTNNKVSAPFLYSTEKLNRLNAEIRSVNSSNSK